MISSKRPAGRLTLVKPRRAVGWMRARLTAPLIPAETAEAVLDRYGLGLARKPVNLALSWRNRNVIVFTGAGRKVLKQYRETSTSATITHEHSIIGHLETRGFPSVRLEHSIEGDTFVEHDGERFALFDFEPGRHCTATYMTHATRERLLEIAGRTLGQLHEELAGFRPTGAHHLGIDPGSGRRHRDLGWHLDTLDRLARENPEPGSHPGAQESDWLRARAGRVAESIRGLSETVEASGLDQTVIHGDYGIHNLLFRADETAVVHDFELARLDRRLLDVAIALSRVPAELAGAFLAGYRRTRELSDREMDHMGALWRHHLLTGAVRSWYGYTRFGGLERLAKARSRVEEAERLGDAAASPWRPASPRR